MAYQYDYDESYDWEPPAEKVHSYGSPASSRGYRDPQVLADPTSLGYDDSYLSPPPARRNQPYGAVNPNFVYPAAQGPAHPRTHSVYDSEQGGVMREQYCICSRMTDFERRLLVTVVVLSVVCVALLATLGGFMPSILCGKACADENGGGGSLTDLLPFMGTRIERMLPG